MPNGDRLPRRHIPVDHYGWPPRVEVVDGVRYLLPGNAAIMRRVQHFSGDSMRDIAQAVAMTGRGGHGSGEVWHHMHDYDAASGHGTLVLMDAAVHAALAHHGGSAQARAVIHDDPDRRARYRYLPDSLFEEL